MIPGACPHVICCGGTQRTRGSKAVWNNDPACSEGHGALLEMGGTTAVAPLHAG